MCNAHGGLAPQVRAAGLRRTAEADARKAFGRLSDHAVAVEDPFSELAKLAGEAIAWKDYAAGRIADLEQIDSTDMKGTEQVRAQVVLFERAMDRCGVILKDYAKLGIEDRLARVTEAQKVTIVRAVNAAFDEFGEAGREPALRAAAERVLARELTRRT